jgi:hypothetical protein
VQPKAEKDPDTAADLAGIRALRARHGGVAPQHLQQFLQKLPQNVIVGSEIVSVRGGITNVGQKHVHSIFKEQEPSIALTECSIEDAVNHLVKAAENVVSSPIHQKALPKTSDDPLPHHTLVVRQPGGQALPKMQMPSDTTVGAL